MTFVRGPSYVWRALLRYADASPVCGGCVRTLLRVPPCAPPSGPDGRLDLRDWGHGRRAVFSRVGRCSRGFESAHGPFVTECGPLLLPVGRDVTVADLSQFGVRERAHLLILSGRHVPLAH
jgi:hypothetical protein